jgi:hypothetical protein
MKAFELRQQYIAEILPNNQRGVNNKDPFFAVFLDD